MKLCISDIFGSLNRGDALLCDALVDSIKDALPRAELTGIAHFPEFERPRHPDIDWQEAPSRSRATNLMLRRVVNGLRSLLTLGYSAIGAPAALAPVYPLPKSQLAAIQHLKSADLVVSSAGGFLLDANATIYSHLLQLHLAKRFGKPYVLGPQTIGPIRSPRLRRLTARVLSGAQLIAVREQYSYDFVVNELGLPAEKVLRTTDIAFEHEKTDPALASAALAELGIGPEERFIGATTVNWKFRGEADPGAAWEAYRDRMVALLQALHARHGLRIVLFNQVSQDLPLAREVAARCQPFVVLDEADRDTEVMRAMIERAEVMLGSRFHSCVFSLLGRVPLYCIAYTYKSTGIMEDLGLSDLVAPIGSFEVEAVAEAVSALLENREAASARIDAAVRSMRFPRFSDVLGRVVDDLNLPR